MAYDRHFRISMIGSLPGPEMFQMNISLANTNGLNLGDFINIGPLVWNDVADDCAAWFGDPATSIHSAAVLQRVKVAAIGTDGKYEHAPFEAERIQAGGGSVDIARQRPNQIARVVTLHTNGDLGRVKGRFYVPAPTMLVDSTGRWSEAAVDAAEARDRTFINDLNNQPGFDVLDLHVVVASQGRHSTNGVQTHPPTNWVVEDVSVGRVPDTQRRRRNKLSEARTAVAL